jgi:hypothetical protein
MKNTALVLTLIFTITLISGCGSKNEVKEYSWLNAEGEISDDGNIIVETPEGAFLETGENVSLPDDFPEDIHVTDGDILSVIKNVVGAGHMLTMTTKYSMNDLTEEYNKELKKDGWKINSSMVLPTAVLISGEKDGRMLSVSFGPDEDREGNSVVILNVMKLE